MNQAINRSSPTKQGNLHSPLYAGAMEEGLNLFSRREMFDVQVAEPSRLEGALSKNERFVSSYFLRGRWFPGASQLSRLSKGGEVQHYKEGDEICRDEHER